MKALCFDKFGEADVLYYSDIPEPTLGENEILLEMKSIGLNYADVYRRKGNYHLEGNPPFICGYEGAGVVKQVGSKVTDFKEGDRVAFADVPYANAELVTVSVEKAIPLSDKISFDEAAALMLQGLTAQYLTHDSYKVSEGEWVLIHAAAGGVGQYLTQIAKARGAKVIGLTSKEEKKEAALNAGADFVFLYGEDWVGKVKEVTTAGVHVAYESVGATIMDSFAATRDTGTVVFFGMAGGDPVHIDPRMLMDTSKTLTGGDLWSYLVSKEERLKRSAALFEMVEKGEIKVNIDKKFSLSEGSKAHAYLESRQSKGKILLIP
ncbi:quinone oxidoreductase family protein [Sediminitomix flava]|uniref:NADPH2:quinone reductase n=1 Tax=Sediminitomix flava TaxID=379075 RepID=A0A315ZHD4_SEDFL|nr:quinone oxidoreductase [Sediminitomix flava]PWJ44124.1 NADPH2:quinone reductase [Sediminitomix flava]